MAARTPEVEAFLAEFHDARPGLTSKVYASLPVMFRSAVRGSTYEVLAATVPAEGRSLEVLDLACGDGFLLSLLASRRQDGVVLCGADMSAGEVEAARKRLGPPAQVVQARAQELPFTSGRFDYVLCHLALMLMDGADRVMHEGRRVLKTGGTLAAIVGASPPASAVTAHYAKALSRHERPEKWSSLRFGDRRFRSAEGIAELLAPEFTDLSIEDIRISMRLSPRELWRFLLDMYDLYLFDEAQRGAVEEELLQALAAECAADGKLEFTQAMRYFTAVAGAPRPAAPA